MRHCVWTTLFIVAGCSVPNVVFDDAGTGSADAGHPREDGSPADGEAEVAPLDAAQDGGLPEGGPLSCPAMPPPGASMCCGAVACSGCVTDDCAKCESQCTAAQLCCVRMQSITCHTMGTCP